MTKRLVVMAAAAALVCAAEAKEWPGFSRGMGIGGWLTNYKRFHVLPVDKRLVLTDGDFVHFDNPSNSLDHVHYRGVEPLALRVDRSQDVLECSDHSPVIFTFKLN